MVYRRRPVKKRSNRRRRKQGGWGNTAMKALSIARRVAGLVNAEAKDYYTNQSYFSADYNGTIVSLNGGITQGVADGQRTGDSIKMKELTIRGAVKVDTTVPGGVDVGRLIIYIDKQNDITSGGNLLNTVGSAASVFSPKNDDKYYDTKIIFDRKFNMTTVQNTQFTFSKVIRLNKHVKYNNTTNAIENNALKLLWITQQPAAGAHGSQLMYDTKLSFMDN